MLFLENLIRALLIFNGLRSRHCQRALLGYHYRSWGIVPEVVSIDQLLHRASPLLQRRDHDIMRCARPRRRGVRRPDQREGQDTGHGSDGGGHEACLGKAAGECLRSGGMEVGLQRCGHACSRTCQVP